MNIKKNSGNEKILLAIQDANKLLTVKSLAEKSYIAYKNIHRNITQLLNGGYIRAKTIQEGRKRNKYIGLTSLGMSYNPSEVIEEPNQVINDLEPFESESTSKLDKVEVNTIRLGIGFYKDYARGLGVPNYQHLSLAKLKLEVGMRLIYQSGLINMFEVINNIHNEPIIKVGAN